MARARMLELESRPPEMISRAEDETEAAFDLRNEEHWARYFRQTVVTILKSGHRNKAAFDQQISDERSRSLNAAALNRKLLDDLLGSKIEVSHLLDLVFDGGSHADLQIRPLGVVERKARIQSPDFEVGVDDQAARFLQQSCQ